LLAQLVEHKAVNFVVGGSSPSQGAILIKKGRNMFIRSSTAINDCLIAINNIMQIQQKTERSKRIQSALTTALLFETWSDSEAYKKSKEELKNNFEEKEFFINLSLRDKSEINWQYVSQKARDKAYDELCAFLNCNYKLRDFS